MVGQVIRSRVFEIESHTHIQLSITNYTTILLQLHYYKKYITITYTNIIVVLRIHVALVYTLMTRASTHLSGERFHDARTQ